MHPQSGQSARVSENTTKPSLLPWQSARLARSRVFHAANPHGLACCAATGMSGFSVHFALITRGACRSEQIARQCLAVRRSVTYC